MRLSAPKTSYQLLEKDQQKLAVEYASHHWWGKHLICIPNGTELPGTPAQRAKYARFLEAMGLKPGASDLFLALPSRLIDGQYLDSGGSHMHGAWFEMKRERGPRGGIRNDASSEQLAFLCARHDVGYYVDLAFGFAEWKSSVHRYLKGFRFGMYADKIGISRG